MTLTRERLDRFLDAPSDDAEVQPYLDAASVLAAFDPLTLWPVGGGPQAGEALLKRLLPRCEPVADGPAQGLWSLALGERREGLRRLGTRTWMKEALAANPARLETPLQRMLERVIVGGPVVHEELPREELAALLTVNDWLQGVVGEIPDEVSARRVLNRTDLLAPMRRLTAGGFVDRTHELARLKAFVAGPPAAPLFVFGPGGVGKSTLLAKLLLDELERPDRAMAYLDIDRPGILPEQPLTLLLDALPQLRMQLDLSPRADGLAEQIAETLGRVEGMRQLESAGDAGRLLDRPVPRPARRRAWRPHDDPRRRHVRGGAVPRAGRRLAAARLPRPPGERGADGSDRRLGPRAPFGAPVRGNRSRRARRRVGARAAHPRDRPRAARAAHRRGAGRRGRDSVAQPDVPAAGRAAAPRRGRRAPARDPQPGAGAAAAEKAQALLYGRILHHIHDEDVKRIAYPGLILRRITPEVIREVLAGPCELELTPERNEHAIFGDLQREAALVEPEVDGSVRHRIDVRRAMLEDLAENVDPQVVAEIDEKAVAYYERQDGPMARAEELYHRLRRREDPRTCSTGVGSPRRATGCASACEELPAEQRLWLAEKLGATLDQSVREEASQEAWEAQAKVSVDRYLQSRFADDALGVLHEREQRLPRSELYGLEAEAYRFLGRHDDALRVARTGVDSMTRDGAIDGALELLLKMVNIEEGRGGLAAAATLVAEAAAVAEHSGDELLRLRTTVTEMRVRRRADPDGHDARAQSVPLACATARAAVALGAAARGRRELADPRSWRRVRHARHRAGDRQQAVMLGRALVALRRSAHRGLGPALVAIDAIEDSGSDPVIVRDGR